MNILDTLDELGFDTNLQVEEFLKYLKANYSYIYNISLSGPEVIRFLKQDYVRRASVEKKADLFSDFLLSQGNCEVME